MSNVAKGSTPSAQQPSAQPPPWRSPLWEQYGGCGQKVEVEDVDWADRAYVPHSSEPLKFYFSWRKLWRFAGPGWLMSLAYLDPGNLESNLQQGAYTRYELVWVLWWSTFTGLMLQEMSARIALVTGRDLAQTVREEYPLWLSRLIYVMMELAVIGSDIQEVVGSGVAFNLLSAGAIPVWIGCLITALDTVTFLGVGYFGVRYLEGLVCLFIGVMLFCFFQNWVLTGFEPKEMLTGWAVPYLPSYGFTQAVGTLGAVIMPHNLYLHSGLVLSRKVTRSSPHRVYEAVQYARIEMAVALLVAFAINLSVVATNSSSFFSRECAEADEGPYACLTHAAYELINGEHPKPRPKEGLGAACTVTSRVGGERGLVGHCGEIGLENAGLALADTLGGNALTVWALGMLAAGQASTMVCTYAGQIIMGGLLAIELPPWKRVALTRVIAIGPSLAVALYATSDPGALNFVNEFLNIMQSLLLPFAMLPALHFAAAPHILGGFRSPPSLMALTTCLALVVLFTNSIVIGGVIAALGFTPLSVVGVGITCALYVGVCLRMVWSDLKASAWRIGRLLASCCTFIRYKSEDCCWLLCGDQSGPPGGASGGLSDAPRQRITEGILDADATMEGELLGRLLTPESLALAARAHGRSSSTRTGQASGNKPPRNLMPSFSSSSSRGGGGGDEEGGSRFRGSGTSYSGSGTSGSYAPPKMDLGRVQGGGAK